MKTKWIILLLVLGVLFFGLGCLADSVAVEGIGAVALFPGLTGVMERVWKEGEGRRLLSAFKLWIDARVWKMVFAF